MERFIHRENIAHYRRLLAEANVTNNPVRHASCCGYWLPRWSSSLLSSASSKRMVWRSSAGTCRDECGI
jgi:hypothetical protein